MPVLSTRRLQSKLINEMLTLCGTPDIPGPMTKYFAARRISGEDEFNDARSSQDSLVKISYKTVIRYYEAWLDFGELPCDHKVKYLKHKDRKNMTRWIQIEKDYLFQVIIKQR